MDEHGADDLLQLPRKLADDQVPLLMAEYEHLAASFIANEEMGERRVNVFFGLIGAATAGVGLAADQFDSQAALALAVAAASVALLAFGLVTLRRLMERNSVTTSYLNGLARIRAFFVLQDTALAPVLPFVPDAKLTVRQREPWWGIGKAGYLELAAVANCLLTAAASAAVGWQLLPLAALLAAASAAAVVAWLVQMRWAQIVYSERQSEEAEQRRKALQCWSTARTAPDDGR